MTQKFSNGPRLLALVLACLTLVLNACSGGGSREVDGTGPVEKVVLSGTDVTCRLRSGATLAAGLDMRVFGGMKSDPPLSQLEDRLGTPTGTRQDEHGQTWTKFKTDGGHLEAGLETHVSGTEKWTLWRVYASPSQGPASAFLQPEIKEHVDLGAPFVSLVVEPANRREAVLCLIEKGEVKRCRWFDQAKSQG